MDVIPLLVLFSLVLALLGVVLFLVSVKNRDLEHADRLSLLPLESDDSSLQQPERSLEGGQQD